VFFLALEEFTFKIWKYTIMVYVAEMQL